MKKLALSICLLPISLFACDDCINYITFKYHQSFIELHSSDHTDLLHDIYLHGQCEAYLDIYNEMMMNH